MRSIAYKYELVDAQGRRVDTCTTYEHCGEQAMGKFLERYPDMPDSWELGLTKKISVNIVPSSPEVSGVQEIVNIIKKAVS